MRLDRPFSSKNGHLCIDGVDSTKLAKKFGTPLLVTSEERIKENAERFIGAFKKYYPKAILKYAIKANWNPAIISILAKEGVGMDASSIGELKLAEAADVDPKTILFSPNFAPVDELKYALDKGITINFDDIGQFEALSDCGVPKIVSFRLNPGFGKGAFPGIVTAGPEAKFGIPMNKIENAYKMAKRKGVKRFGIHMMAGSNVLTPDYFASITSKILGAAGSISSSLGIKFEFIDIGGGFGVPYKFGEASLNVDVTAKKVAEIFKKGCMKYDLGKPILMTEPGRYLVADSTVLLGTVNHVKSYSKTFIGTDVGMNTLIRAPLYDAYHEVAIANKIGEKASMTASITGQICENSDVLAKDRRLPAAKVGDLVAFFTAGAYVYSMANQYGSRPRPAEVLITKNKTAKLIRRRENFDDLFATIQH